MSKILLIGLPHNDLTHKLCQLCYSFYHNLRTFVCYKDCAIEHIRRSIIKRNREQETASTTYRRQYLFSLEHYLCIIFFLLEISRVYNEINVYIYYMVLFRSYYVCIDISHLIIALSQYGYCCGNNIAVSVYTFLENVPVKCEKYRKQTVYTIILFALM